jgi:RHS repeat-associated protein
MAHLPFGEDFAENGSQAKRHFTSYERDAESGTDYAINREYSMSAARFLRVDPKASSARLDAPQSWNRYSYVQNEPISQSDRLGLDIPGPGPQPGEPPHPPGPDPYFNHEHGLCPAWIHDCGAYVGDPGFSGIITIGALGGGAGGEGDGGLSLGFGGDPADPDACPADKRRFFNWLAGPLATMAQDVNTTLTLMLTLAAKEGGWTTGDLNHNQPLNNPFGVNRISHGRAAGNVHYPSLDAAIQYWEETFGDRVRGAQSAEAFINGLEHPAQGAPYNKNIEKYTKVFMDVYSSMLKYMKICGIQ